MKNQIYATSLFVIIVLTLGFALAVITNGEKDVLNDSLRSKTLRIVHSSYSYCSGCGLPWSNCESKAVRYSPNRGTFATCQDCWNSLSLEELKWCYTQTFYSQGKIEPDKLEHLLECVERDYNGSDTLHDSVVGVYPENIQIYASDYISVDEVEMVGPRTSGKLYSEPQQINYDTISFIDFNTEKDAFISKLFDTKPHKTSKHTSTGVDRYKIYFKDVLIEVYHKKHIPFEQSEEWKYYATKENGEGIYINGTFTQNSIRPSTLQKIKEYCLTKI